MQGDTQKTTEKTIYITHSSDHLLKNDEGTIRSVQFIEKNHVYFYFFKFGSFNDSLELKTSFIEDVDPHSYYRRKSNLRVRIAYCA